ncbi:MAG: hypothetical protein WCT44_02140 [Candidatus Paceibacterota bacterium]
MEENIQGNKKVKKLWFKRRMYGWGWMPISWEGWAVTIIYILSLAGDLKFINDSHNSFSATLASFIPRFIFLTLIFVGVCLWKGEKTKWSWGPIQPLLSRLSGDKDKF